MNTEECNIRARECAANAAITRDEHLAVEFLRLAAQWRAMAVRANLIGQPNSPPVSFTD
jgi:hypothetical protein